MKTSLSVDGYSIEAFVPGIDEKSIIVSLAGPVKAESVDALLTLAKFAGSEIVHVGPKARFTLPPSIFGKTTRVRYAGDAPLMAQIRDQFENPSLVLSPDSAIEVLFFTPTNPAGKTKLVTNRLVIK